MECNEITKENFILCSVWKFTGIRAGKLKIFPSTLLENLFPSFWYLQAIANHATGLRSFSQIFYGHCINAGKNHQTQNPDAINRVTQIVLPHIEVVLLINETRIHPNPNKQLLLAMRSICSSKPVLADMITMAYYCHRSLMISSLRMTTAVEKR